MDSSIDQKFVEFVVRSLVSNPDAVVIERRIDEKGVLLELTVDPEDLGRVIGKRGATAQSIRTLLRALGTKNDARYNLKIVDNGVGDHGSHDGHDSHDSHDDNGRSSNSGYDRRDDSVGSSNSASDDATNPSASRPSNNDGDDDDLDNVVTTSTSSDEIPESDAIAKTRKELEAYDDLDI